MTVFGLQGCAHTVETGALVPLGCLWSDESVGQGIYASEIVCQAGVEGVARGERIRREIGDLGLVTTRPDQKFEGEIESGEW